jgi:hypothetical protein
MLLVERGTVGRRRVLQQFADSLRDAGVLVTVVEAGSLTHRQVNALIGAPGDTVMTGPLTSFLESCFRASSSRASGQPDQGHGFSLGPRSGKKG